MEADLAELLAAALRWAAAIDRRTAAAEAPAVPYVGAV